MRVRTGLSKICLFCLFSAMPMSAITFAHADTPVGGNAPPALPQQYSDQINAALDAERRRDLVEATRQWHEAAATAETIGKESWIAYALTGIGRTANRPGNSTEAKAALERALSLRQKQGEQIGQAEDLHYLGQIAMNELQYPKAIDLFQKALVIDRSIAGQQQWIGFDVSFLSLLCQRVERNAEALGYVQELISIAATQPITTSEDHRGNALRLRVAGELETRLDKLDAAEPHIRQASAEFQSISNDPEWANTLLDLARIQMRRNDSAATQATLKSASELFEKTNDDSGRALVLQIQGELAFGRGAEEEAEAETLRALALAEKADNRPLQGDLHGLLSKWYLVSGKSSKALDEIGLADEMTDVIDKPSDKADRIETRALILSAVGQHSEAIKRFEAARKIHQAIAETPAMRLDDQFLAREYIGLNDPQHAEPYLSEAETGDKELPNGDPLTELLQAAAQFQQGSIESAAAGFQRVLTISDSAVPRAEELKAGAYDGLARCKLVAGDGAAALDLFAQAASLAAGFDEPDLSFRIDAGIQLALAAQGRQQESVIFGKRAVNTIQQLRIGAQALAPDMQASLIQDKRQVYSQLADTLIDLDRLAEAEQVLDLLKQEEYFEFVRGDAAHGVRGTIKFTDLEKVWVERYGVVSHDLSNKQRELIALRHIDSGLQTDDQRKRMSELNFDLSVSRNAYRALLNELATRTQPEQTGEVAANKAANDLGAPLRATLRRLGPGAVLLHYLVTADKVRIVLVTPDGEFSADKAIDRSDLNRRVVEFSRVLQDPEQPPKAAAQALYEVLITPIADRLKAADAKTLMVSLQGNLRYVPLAALFDGKQWLVEKYAIATYTPAALANLEIRPPLKWSVAAFGVSKAYPPLPALKAVPWELREVMAQGSTANKSKSITFPKLDADFTAKALSEVLKRKYSLVHIASHFQFLPGNEADSFLLLGDGLHLSLADFRDGSYPLDGVEMLTLSACSTAMGGGSRADGTEVEGFGALAQNLGARSVLASLWSVRDGPTGLLMERLYADRERQHLSKAKALQKAQIEFLAGHTSVDDLPADLRDLVKMSDEAKADRAKGSQKLFTHPYYWASFVIMGNWL